ncbi:methyltransferase domain-containing protein [Halobaculum sp. WSA2]|uniref:Methyltransferase domain-containing protein n=1 Tax=Halobaculum saliterrae TaxID=2073113 RepID=A0A6B0SQG0_9EURY|nr:class I SAM-dependent methyltransferase [Halobaculum saliterrae]MXR39826.1 methyltransferase domain-containing protein [Halobaculum saliterrae]
MSDGGDETSDSGPGSDGVSTADLSARFEANREHWEEMVEPVSVADGTAEIEAFLDGESALLPVQRREVGDATGDSLLDLQCSIGTRTLSWARMGATVTGVDISAESVRVARELAAAAGLADDATFVRANVYDLPEAIPEPPDGGYDTVVSNFGVLCWLPDLDRWAEVVAESLAPGGTFHLAEHHPIATALSDDLGGGAAGEISVEHPYFSTDDPVPDGDTHKWTHGLGEILTALVDAGIDLRSVNEQPFSPIRRSEAMVEDGEGRWRFEDHDLPLLVTVTGTRRESVADE